MPLPRCIKWVFWWGPGKCKSTSCTTATVKLVSFFLINHPHKFLRVRPLPPPPPCWGESAGGRGIGDLWDANANVFLHAVAGHWCQVVSRVLGENIRNCRPLWNSGGKWWQTVVFNSASETWFRTFQNYITWTKTCTIKCCSMLYSDV